TASPYGDSRKRCVIIPKPKIATGWSTAAIGVSPNPARQETIFDWQAAPDGYFTRSYIPRSRRLTAPPSIQRVIAAKISEERLSRKPRTPRISLALNCLGSLFNTSPQLIRDR